MTKDEVIERLKELSVKLGTPRLRRQDLREAGLVYQVDLHFPNMVEALKEAGLEPTPLAQKMNTSDEELLNYLISLGKKTGKRPTVMSVRRDGKYSDKIFEIRFGNIQQAYEKALSKKTEKKEIKEEKTEPSTPDFQPLFWGKAAEYLIASELLYRNFNANLQPVDLGVDVVAIKDNKTFYFQVKNISLINKDIRTIPITVSAFIRNQGGNMFYMFLLVRKNKRSVLVLPYHIMDSLIKKKIISFDEDSRDFSLCISMTEDNIVKIHKTSDKAIYEEVSSYLDVWDVIV